MEPISTRVPPFLAPALANVSAVAPVATHLPVFSSNFSPSPHAMMELVVLVVEAASDAAFVLLAVGVADGAGVADDADDADVAVVVVSVVESP